MVRAVAVSELAVAVAEERRPLIWVPLERCVLTWGKGELRRMMAAFGNPLIGYTIACPRCGAKVTAMPSRYKFAEGPWTKSHFAFRKNDDEDEPLIERDVAHPSGLTITPDLKCHGCGGRTFGVRDGEFVL